METWFKIRNKIIRWKYRWFLRPILFKFDSEQVHDRFVNIGKFLGKFGFARWLIRICFYYENPVLAQEILGISFKNPIGLAAGFDKNAEMIDIMSAIGFSFTEIGSVTGRPCAGNPKPRLWRLLKSRSLIVYYGLKNNGAQEISQRLKNKKFSLPVGISIAKTNDDKTITTEDGLVDYLSAYKAFASNEIGDYYTINISCPSTFAGEPFVEPIKLDKLLSALVNIQRAKPIFLKMPPGLSHEQIDQIIDLARKYKISGFICTNLSKDRILPSFQDKIKESLPTNQGGLSGKIVEELANEQIKYFYQKTGKEFVIIGCGGVFTAEDAYKKIKAGASLIQLITGMIFDGPQIISEINQGLAKLLAQDGYKNITEAIGTGD